MTDERPATWLDTTMHHNPKIDDACAKGVGAQGSNLGHMPRIYHVLVNLKPKIVFETGVGAPSHGASTHTLLLAAKELGFQVWSLDNSNRKEEWFSKEYPDLVEDWNFVLCDSKVELAHPKVKPIDFLHLDSDHSYEHVHGELEAVKPYLAERHVIAGHDTEVEQVNCRKAVHEWAEANGYTIKQFEDWHGETFLTKQPELLKGLV